MPDLLSAEPSIQEPIVEEASKPEAQKPPAPDPIPPEEPQVDVLEGVEEDSKRTFITLSYANGVAMGVRLSQLNSFDVDYNTGLGFSLGATSSFENKNRLMAFRFEVHGMRRFIDNFWQVDGRVGLGYAVGTDWSSLNTSPFVRVGGRGGFRLTKKLSLFADLNARWTFYTAPKEEPLMSPVDVTTQIGLGWAFR